MIRALIEAVLVFLIPFVLFGIVLLYGYSGSVRYSDIAAAVTTTMPSSQSCSTLSTSLI